MLKYILNRLDLMLTFIVGFVALALLVVLPIDAYDFFNAPDDYILVYHLDPSLEWWWLDYLGYSIIYFIAALLTLTAIILAYKRPKTPYIRPIKSFFVYGFILWTLMRFYLWYLTGFDH